MIKNSLKKGGFLLAVIFAVIVFYSCSKADEYKKYTKGGEILYTGKMDSLKVFSGKNRVKLTGMLSADPKVTSYRVYWGTQNDSITVPVNEGEVGDSINKIIDGLQENIYNFTVRTFDAQGNASIPSFVTGKVYGDRYIASITNRPILDAKYIGSDLEVNFVTIDLTNGAYATELHYRNVDDDAKTLDVSIDSSSVVLPNFKPGGSFEYRTFFKPDSTSIDIFKTAFDTLTPQLVPDPPYLKNAAIPFKKASSGGRWGILADWTQNETTKNHGGYGVWDKRDEGRINIQSGYGDAPITNGKIYQSFYLDPGTYTLQTETYGSNYDGIGDQCYLTAAKGLVLPDVPDVETSMATLGFTQITSGNTYTTTFTLSELTQVAIGIAVTTNSGVNRYSAFKYISLTKQ